MQTDLRSWMRNGRAQHASVDAAENNDPVTFSAPGSAVFHVAPGATLTVNFTGGGRRDAASPLVEVQQRRQSYSYNEKYAMLKLAESIGISAVATRKGISEKCLYTWRRESVLIVKAITMGRGAAHKLRPMIKYKELGEKLWRLYTQYRSLVLAVTFNVLNMWGMRNCADFRQLSAKARTRILKTWRDQHGLRLRRTTGLTQLVPDDYEQRVAHFTAMLRSMYSKNKYVLVAFCDETYVLQNPASRRTLEKFGAKHVRVRVCNEKSGCTVLLSAVYSPTKKKTIPLSPYVVFRAVKNGTIQKRHATRNESVVRCNTKGWMTEELFLDWIDVALPKLPRSRANPLQYAGRGLLVMDLFRAHSTEKVRARLNALGWDTAYVPGGCTSGVQLHDVYVNRPFKAHIEKAYALRRCDAGDASVTSREEMLSWIEDANVCDAVFAALEKGGKHFHDTVIDQPAPPPPPMLVKSMPIPPDVLEVQNARAAQQLRDEVELLHVSDDVKDLDACLEEVLCLGDDEDEEDDVICYDSVSESDDDVQVVFSKRPRDEEPSDPFLDTPLKRSRITNAKPPK